MSDQVQVQPEPPNTLEIRRIDPKTTRIFRGEFNLPCCEIPDEGIYRAIFAVRTFPINHPERFISVCYFDDKDKVQEIGIIDDLEKFREDAREIIRESLERHYYEQTVTRVHSLKWEFGLLHFDVETENGKLQFLMRWQQDKAQDFGERGKVLLDVFENRYIIPDVEKLPPGDQLRFTRYIYW
jgi:ATP-binding cassette, subfamily B, bacterial